jgi:hypothetical protein
MTAAPRRSTARSEPPKGRVAEIADLRWQRLTGPTRSSRSRRRCATSASARRAVHIDVKKLGRIKVLGHRITGKSPQSHARRRLKVHARLHRRRSRPAYSEMLPVSQTRPRPFRCRRPIAATAWRQACGARGLGHIRTKRHTPSNQRQGRALHPDQFARVSPCEAFASSQRRREALADWLGRFNTVRGAPRWPTSRQPPASAKPSSLVRPEGRFPVRTWLAR